ncbi:DUF1292 domain-containing protein [Kurthia sibirica]|uniref:UPF0473 protein DEX24_11190 n=1 Tax=Kurthia sibirica TaxID=202750 RepID=A0A2U3AJV7_9BACL|nr:DUF1292 domain-containing protein [Kurthia sibirica]PWI24820.1 hypothetical protein DEX24_11190 [Kurthia sibirica]GEK33334.1 hypothetical protein KSI01_08670 [Kurthia sibirica]
MSQEHDHEHIVAIDEDGNEIVYAVITRAHSEELQKDFVLFAEHSDSEEAVEVQAAQIIQGEDGESLVGVEDDADWDFIEAVLKELDEAEDEA